MLVEYSDLKHQFPQSLRDDIFKDIALMVDAGDYTLGKAVDEFEQALAQYLKVRYVIGVNSGTEALYLTMKGLGIGVGDEVVTVPNTFPATVGAIIQTGATPRFADVNDTDEMFLMPFKNPPTFPVSPNIKALIPVDWSGDVTGYSMPRIPLTKNLGRQLTEQEAMQNTFAIPWVIHDASQAIGARYTEVQKDARVEKTIGQMGKAACFSFHPLKNLNVWGDAGAIATDDPFLAAKLRSLRNHGLLDRDTWIEPGVNGRIATIQAIVGKHILKTIDEINAKRRATAKMYDEVLATVKGVQIPPRSLERTHVYHLYQIQADRRDELVAFLNKNDIQAKVHYPTPLHLQPALRSLYKVGDFPVAEKQAGRILSLPVHQHMGVEHVDYVVAKVREFYRGG